MTTKPTIARDSVFYGKVYDALVNIGGAHPMSRGSFLVDAELHNWDEYRFMGHLGHGGKYWRKSNRVNCYPEDATPARHEIMLRLNFALAQLEYAEKEAK